MGGIKPVKPVGAELVDKIEAYLGCLGCGKKERRDHILGKLKEMPSRYRKSYLKAIMGKSRAHAVKVHCLECMGWKKAYVATCESWGCPFWTYRPYQKRCEPQKVCVAQ
jgi:hypothetical protein